MTFRVLEAYVCAGAALAIPAAICTERVRTGRGLVVAIGCMAISIVAGSLLLSRLPFIAEAVTAIGVVTTFLSTQYERRLSPVPDAYRTRRRLRLLERLRRKNPKNAAMYEAILDRKRPPASL